MAFDVRIADEVVLYIHNRERLTISDENRIIDGIKDALGKSADEFLKRNPHPYLPDRYWYDYFLMTDAHEVREFRFACSAEGHIYGVTEVLYAEEQQQE